VTAIESRHWTADVDAPVPSFVEVLEEGNVLFLPRLPFAVEASERALFSPAIASAAKNVSFDVKTAHLRGAALEGAPADTLKGLLARFAGLASALARQLLPAYRDRIELGRTSFRPVEIAGRTTSWRKDDTRLHVDAFPATPVHGWRILRVFSNVNPAGRARIWRIGGDFEDLVRRFAGRLHSPLPGAATALRLLHVTKSRRSTYDSLMLQLHDCMKADSAYQAEVAQTQVEFPAGTTWIAFTDQVSHAATAGQYQLEQTFLLPVDAMMDEQRSPLRILERVMGGRLV
jgi:hypothetical protein